jgi:ferritin-like metal-binding protein YciE
MKMTSLEDLLVDQLRDLYNAETQLIKALPKMAKAATNTELEAGFQKHLEQTRHHAERLEQVLEKLGQRAKGKKCYAMESLIEEGQEMMGEDAEPDVLDAGLIATAQKVEHFEIAGYGTVCAWAEQVGHHDVLDLLRQTLQEEKETNEKFTHVAESMVHIHAAAGHA